MKLLPTIVATLALTFTTACPTLRGGDASILDPNLVQQPTEEICELHDEYVLEDVDLGEETQFNFLEDSAALLSMVSGDEGIPAKSIAPLAEIVTARTRNYVTSDEDFDDEWLDSYVATMDEYLAMIHEAMQ